MTCTIGGQPYLEGREQLMDAASAIQALHLAGINACRRGEACSTSCRECTAFSSLGFGRAPRGMPGHTCSALLWEDDLSSKEMVCSAEKDAQLPRQRHVACGNVVLLRRCKGLSTACVSGGELGVVPGQASALALALAAAR